MEGFGMERAIISRAPLKWVFTGFEKFRFNETIERTNSPVRPLGRQAFPFMRTEKARISPFLAAAYPLKARTPFNTPVFTLTRRESTPRRRLFFTVPSTPNTASDAMNSGRSLKSLCAASRSVARARGEARFILLKPEPSARTISFAETPMEIRKSRMTRRPFSAVPGAPCASAPIVLRTCSATKLLLNLLSPRTTSLKGGERFRAKSFASGGVAARRIPPFKAIPCLLSSTATAPAVKAVGSVTGTLYLLILFPAGNQPLT